MQNKQIFTVNLLLHLDIYISVTPSLPLPHELNKSTKKFALLTLSLIINNAQICQY